MREGEICKYNGIAETLTIHLLPNYFITLRFSVTAAPLPSNIVITHCCRHHHQSDK